MGSFTLILIPFFLSLLRLLSPATAANHPDIILQTCKRCSESSPNVNYSLCISSLGSVPKSHQTDLRGLGVIAVKLAAVNAKHTRSQVKNLLKEWPKDPHLKSCLGTCCDLYTDAISSLNDSATAIKSGDYDGANLLISSAVDAPGTCEDSFEEDNIRSPLAGEDKYFFQLAVIALAVVSLLE